MLFEEYIKEYIAQRVNVDFLLDQIQYGLLRDIVEHCMGQTEYKLSLQKRAESTLSALFSQLVRGYSFTAFLDQVTKSEREPFLTSLLYHIYYINLTLEHLASQDKLTYYLLRVLASQASEKSLLKIFSGLSYEQQFQCIGFCLVNFDEGAYRLFSLLVKKGSKEIQELLGYVRYNLIDKKGLGQWLLSQPSISADWVQQLLVACREDIAKRIARVEKKLGLTDLTDSLMLFGLYDHQVPKEAWHLHEHEALDDKLEAISVPTAEEAEFLEALKMQLTSLKKHPERYVKGIESITFALPTAGKELRLFPWVSSMVEALRSFARTFQRKEMEPLFVFDQSPPALFKKNATYIKRLKAPIIHLGTEEILSLANRLGLEGMLVTTREKTFGFGGARNAIFFLAPLLRHYYREKKDVAAISDAELKRDFREVVLEEKRGPCVIHMGDDDVHVHVSNIFADALFAYNHQNEYFCRFGWVIGRRTTWTETTFNLKYVLERSADILLQHGWQEAPFSHGMAGLLCKPKLCLNLPFGQEEAYLQSMQKYPFDFRLPAMHLSGYRFPKEKLPLTRYSGLAALLKSHYAYSVGMMLVADLIDPADVQKHCALPWNDAGHAFKNLQEALLFMLQPATVKTMQERFWQNVARLGKAFEEYKAEPGQVPQEATLHMGILTLQDISKEVCPEEIKHLFAELAKDAALFKTVLANPTGKEKPSTLPFTSALQLLFDAVGNAGFQKQLRLFTAQR